MGGVGTGGVWRSSAILESGGWSGDTLTEDMDMAMAAAARGWRFKMLPHVEVKGNPLANPNTRSHLLTWNPCLAVALCVRHLSLVQCLSELPSTDAVFRKQQFRWTCGPASILRKHGASVLHSRVTAPHHPLPCSEKKSSTGINPYDVCLISPAGYAVAP